VPAVETLDPAGLVPFLLAVARNEVDHDCQGPGLKNISPQDLSRCSNPQPKRFCEYRPDLNCAAI
jgi:hypothetical protein